MNLNSKMFEVMKIPTQLLIHGQWWSIFNTHRLHSEQWWVLGGLKSLHCLQYLESLMEGGGISIKFSSGEVSEDLFWVDKSFQFSGTLPGSVFTDLR